MGKRYDQAFHKRETVHKHEKMLKLINKEMQIKITKTHHFIPIWLANIKKSDKYWSRYRSTITLVYAAYQNI